MEKLKLKVKDEKGLGDSKNQFPSRRMSKQKQDDLKRQLDVIVELDVMKSGVSGHGVKWLWHPSQLIRFQVIRVGESAWTIDISA
jgi:hypothetical protein